MARISGNDGGSGFIRDLCVVGRLDEALQSMENMHQQGAQMWRDIIYLALQGCTKKKDLTAGKRVHSLMVAGGLDSTAILGDHTIRLFALYGSLLEANIVFCKIEHPSVYTWHAAISAHAKVGENRMALELYNKLQHQGIKPGKFTFSCILKSCGSIRALGQGKLVHDHIIKNEGETDVVVGSSIIDMYVKCGHLEEAQKVFDSLQNRNEVSWNSMIAGYAENGHSMSAFHLFEKMQQEGMSPGKVTFLCILKACKGTRALQWGQLVHGVIIRNGLGTDVVIGSALVDMYAKSGNVEDARKVFDNLPNKNAVIWGAMISGYAQQGHGHLAFGLFERMQEEGFKPDEILYSCVLKGCGSIGVVEKGELIYEQIIKSGVKSDAVLRSTLIDMYAKCGKLEDAQKVFKELSDQNVVCWSTMIAGYCQHGYDIASIELFDKMQHHGIKPDRITFTSVLKACGSLAALPQGRLVHDQIMRSGLQSDVVVGSTLIDLYAKCGYLGDARRVFDKLLTRNSVSWGAMITGYTQHGLDYLALELVARMQEEGIKPGKATLLSTLKAYGSIRAIPQGKLVHGQLMGCKIESDVVLENTLVDMYAKCGALEEARKVFDEMATKDVVSWGAMIAGYAQNRDGLKALQLFETMYKEGIWPDSVTFSCILKACCSIGAIGQGKLIHDQILRSGLAVDLVLGNTLVDLYIKCGTLEEAHKVLDGLSNRNIVSWNTVIAGCAEHGAYGLAVQSFNKMRLQGLRPVSTSYTSYLAACSHAGQVQEGGRCFKSMIDEHSITPTIKHFNCMIDILGRAGHLKEAEELLRIIPIAPDATSWISLLTACRLYGNMILGQKCFEQVLLFDSDTASGYVIMSNICADAYKWEDVYRLQGLKLLSGAWKEPGRAWLEVHSKRHEFIAGDTSRKKAICQKWT